jgi:hypothetical protein
MAVPALTFMLHCTAAPAASPDPYLSAINAEGNQLESLGRARQEQDALLRQQQTPAPKAAAAAPVRRASAPAAVTSQKQFEDTLRKSFPGSYALYSIMNTDEQGEVYAEFQKKDVEGSARFIPVVVKIIAITSSNSTNRARAQKQ